MVTSASLRRLMMTTDAVGGVWTFATALTRALCDRGTEVLLVIMGPPPSADAQAELRKIANLTLEVSDLALEWMDPQGRDRMRARAALLAMEKQFAPDAVHLNGYREASYGWTAPVIVTAHSCVQSWWRACLESAAPEDWDDYTRAVSDGLRNAQFVTAPTRAMLESLAAIYGFRTPSAVVPNGVRVTPHPAYKRPAVLTAGRLWDRAKNIGLLDRVAGDLPWPVHALGSTADPMNGVAEHFAHLICHQDVPREDVLAAMAAAEIYAAPARYEPFGLSILEAAASGCALVLGDIPTLRELWDGAALFAPPDDAEAFHKVLLHLIRDDSMRRDFQRRAMTRARRYGPTSMVDGYCEIYHSLATPALYAEGGQA